MWTRDAIPRSSFSDSLRIGKLSVKEIYGKTMLFRLSYYTMNNVPFDICKIQGSDTPMHGVNSFLVLRFMK